MIIGITGGIGTGKSVISSELRRMGYAVYDSDTQAKRLIVEDPALRLRIQQLFGPEAYRDGVYQTQWVAQRVFADPQLLAQLNAIVHPAVRQDIRRWADSLLDEVVFVECAILYIAGLDALCDRVVAITAPQQVRLQRVIARDHSTPERVLARMRSQDAERDLLRADWVVNNDGVASINALAQQIIDYIHPLPVK